MAGCAPWGRIQLGPLAIAGSPARVRIFPNRVALVSRLQAHYPSAHAGASRSIIASLDLRPTAGCSVDDVDLRGKECPCVDGYVCDTSIGTCVPFVVDGGAGQSGASGASGAGGSTAGAAGAGAGGTSSGGASSGGASSGGTSSGGTSSGGTSSGGASSGGASSGGASSGGASSGGASSGGTSSGGSGGAVSTCVSSAVAVGCDPLTGDGCLGNQGCELLTVVSVGQLRCVGPPANANPGDACNSLLGPFCAAGYHCKAATKKCVKFCCSNADCTGLGAAATCTPIEPNLGALGTCG